jgi:ubiquinone/menaquinone biosynthesis C-methylase UbiE
VSDRESRGDAFTAVSVPDAYDRYMRPQLFEPWAIDLIKTAGVVANQRVIDVASGTGVVAHLAAQVVGPAGSVLATDISAPMLAVSAARERPPSSAPIEFVTCSATELDAADGSFDFAFCQQGLPFIPDRRAALTEMRRVLVAGGKAAVSVWDGDRPLGLFSPLVESIAEAGLPEPYPGAFDSTTYNMSADDLRSVIASAGFEDFNVDTRSLMVEWPDIETATAAIHGTPFGPMVASLDSDRRNAILESFANRLSKSRSENGAIRLETHAHVGIATR